MLNSKISKYIIGGFILFYGIFFTKFSNASYIYIEPSPYFFIFSSFAFGRTTSPAAGCEAIVQGYKLAAGSQYDARVQRVTATTPNVWSCYMDRKYILWPWSIAIDSSGSIGISYECPVDFIFADERRAGNGSTAMCRGAANMLIALTPIEQSETRPARTGGVSTMDITAKVTSGGQPKSGVAVGFAVKVTDKSGGHDHSNASRPNGTVTPAQASTDANGEIKLKYTAPEVAGTYTITATCGSCSNAYAVKVIEVKVPELVNIFNLPFRDSQWAYPGIGQTTNHTDQHYLTVAAATRMLDISRKFQKIWPAAPKLTLNDASLVWGGKFDISGTWEQNPRAHAEHRLGDNIDIRANSAPGAVPANIRAIVFRWLRDKTLAEDNIPPEFVVDSVNPLRESIGEINEHFHLRLGN